MFLSKKSMPHGFTLIELLIVLVLIGLSSSFVLPSMWQQLEQTKYRSEIAKTKSLFNYCRHYAYYRSTTLEVEVAGNSLTIKAKDDGKLLRQVEFETFDFEEKTLYFDVKSSFYKSRLTIIRSNEKGSVELEI